MLKARPVKAALLYARMLKEAGCGRFTVRPTLLVGPDHAQPTRRQPLQQTKKRYKNRPPVTRTPPAVSKSPPCFPQTSPCRYDFPQCPNSFRNGRFQKQPRRPHMPNTIFKPERSENLTRKYGPRKKRHVSKKTTNNIVMRNRAGLSATPGEGAIRRLREHYGDMMLCPICPYMCHRARLGWSGASGLRQNLSTSTHLGPSVPVMCARAPVLP